jgi:hypothetical protein
MIKQLLLIFFFLFVFANAYAQTRDDSTATRPTDSTIKKPTADTALKSKTVDTTEQHAVGDSVAKHKPADTTLKRRVTDTVVKPTPTDSVISKQKTPDGAGKRPVKNAVKQPTAVPPATIHSPVKTLSDERYNMLLKGEDFDNMALAGELNHYPLPDKALKYKVQLGLNPGQITKLKDIVSALHRKKVEMGDFVIRNEKMLDSLFHTKRVDDGTIIFYTNRYGLYMGELRNAILQACYKTEAILSDVQIRKLESLVKIN